MFIENVKNWLLNANPNLDFCVGKNPLLKLTQELLMLKMTVSIHSTSKNSQCLKNPYKKSLPTKWVVFYQGFFSQKTFFIRDFLV